jgi:hypothetical protein
VVLAEILELLLLQDILGHLMVVVMLKAALLLRPRVNQAELIQAKAVEVVVLEEVEPVVLE